ncbi:MAG: hypothetical protein AB1489_18165 [Acidobacteriota bacterium]
MRKLNSLDYQANLQRLERMADGIAKHSNETKFPATLVEAERRKMRTDLETLRSDYEEKQRAADLAYDTFNTLMKTVEEQLSKDDDTLRGYYGKDNAMVADFGTVVISKTRSARKNNPSKN